MGGIARMFFKDVFIYFIYIEKKIFHPLWLHADPTNMDLQMMQTIDYAYILTFPFKNKAAVEH